MAGNYLIYILLMLIFPGRHRSSADIEVHREECITCHEELLRKSVVHPQLESICDICHASNGEDHPQGNQKGFSLTEKLPLLCFNCHSDFQDHSDLFPILHGPVSDSLSCINCHNPHSSDQPKLLIDGTNNLCLKCHNKTILTDSATVTNINQVLSRAISIHPPVESGGCVICHNPHFSEKKFLLIGNFPSDQYVQATSDNFEICFMCHETDLLEAPSTEFGTNFRNGKKNLHFVHINGDRGRNCTMCHDIHGAASDRLIRDKLKFGSWEMKIEFMLTDNGGSCLTACHSKKSYVRTAAN
jgi:predicted CXXCH cytochrome family protein